MYPLHDIRWSNALIGKSSTKQGKSKQAQIEKYDANKNVAVNDIESRTTRRENICEKTRIFDESCFDGVLDSYESMLGNIKKNTNGAVAGTCFLTAIPFSFCSLIALGSDITVRPIGKAITISHDYIAHCKIESKNKIIREYNKKIPKYQKLVKEIKLKHNNLATIETYLNENKMLVDNNIAPRIFPQYTVLMLIGPTGYGKSVVCNRWIGKKETCRQMTKKEAFLNDVNNGSAFGVAKKGDIYSMSDHTSQISKIVTLSKTSNQTPVIQASFCLTVLDTPGSWDSEKKEKTEMKENDINDSKVNDNINYNQRDTQFEDEMIECVNHIGGINAFLVVFRFGEKATSEYRKLIKKYASFWGDKKFWKHCMIIVTHCDKDSEEILKIWMKLGNKQNQI